MTDEQHMQKAREITAGWRKASHTPWENVHADIASALSEAYRSGVEEERAKAAEALAECDRHAEKIEALLDPHVSWEGAPPKAYATVIEAERERCAKILETVARTFRQVGADRSAELVDGLTAAIRKP